MTVNNIIRYSFTKHIETVELVHETLIASIENIGKVLSRSLSSDGAIFWCGNGGSAADSQHLAAELVGRFKIDRRPLRSMALNTDTSILTCIANDYSYNDIFSRQVKALGRQGDVLVVISTSGNSENILRAVRVGRECGLTTIALLGKDGGLCKGLADHALVVPSENTARIQESHILIGHILCELIEEELGIA